MTRALFCLLFSTAFLLPAPAHAHDENHCHDPANWIEWEAKAAKNVHDLEFQTLHALWMGLCLKVQQGTIALDDAVAIFENARSTLIQKRQEERPEKHLRPSL